jgi:hypothetical protein
MIVSAINTEIDRYYALDKKTIIKNMFDPVTQKHWVEYVQYFYNKVGELEPSKSTGTKVDKYA